MVGVAYGVRTVGKCGSRAPTLRPIQRQRVAAKALAQSSDPHTSLGEYSTPTHPPHSITARRVVVRQGSKCRGGMGSSGSAVGDYAHPEGGTVMRFQGYLRQGDAPRSGEPTDQGVETRVQSSRERATGQLNGTASMTIELIEADETPGRDHHPVARQSVRNCTRDCSPPLLTPPPASSLLPSYSWPRSEGAGSCEPNLHGGERG